MGTGTSREYSLSIWHRAHQFTLGGIDHGIALEIRGPRIEVRDPASEKLIGRRDRCVNKLGIKDPIRTLNNEFSQ